MRRAPRYSLLLLAIWFVASGCVKKPAKRAAVAVRVEVVAPASTVSTARYSGTLQAQTQVELAFRIGGYVASLATRADTSKPGAATNPAGAHSNTHRDSATPPRKGEKQGEKHEDRLIQSGDRVTRNMVLASLRQSDYKQKLSELGGMSYEASAGYKKSSADLERAKALLAQSAISQAEYDAVKARHDGLAGAVGAAAARVGQAGIALSDTHLKSPLDGIVLDRRVEVGALIAPGVPAFVLADTSIVKVVFGVPDSVQHLLTLGSPVTVSTDAVVDRRFVGVITRVAAQADPKTRVFDVEASIDNADGILKVGMVANIQIGRARPQPKGQTAGPTVVLPVLVPLSAIVRVPPNEQGFWVYVTSEWPDGTAVHARPVELGSLVGNRVTVVSGLAIGEHVVTQGATLVTDGERVNVVPAPAAAPGAPTSTFGAAPVPPTTAPGSPTTPVTPTTALVPTPIAPSPGAAPGVGSPASGAR